jgi:hypothetical protein
MFSLIFESKAQILLANFLKPACCRIRLFST